LGIPYKQDIRVGCLTCSACNCSSPPWGHMNSFNEKKLKTLFQALSHASTSYVGETKSRTNFISSYLMDLGRNPWGAYDQEEPCVYCGAKFFALENRNLARRLCTKLATILTRVQLTFFHQLLIGFTWSSRKDPKTNLVYLEEE
jgi:hypothetical protein